VPNPRRCGSRIPTLRAGTIAPLAREFAARRNVCPDSEVRAAAQHYLQENNLQDENWRIDVVAVELAKNGKLLRVDVLENAVRGQNTDYRE
jgi:hypothetical protein